MSGERDERKKTPPYDFFEDLPTSSYPKPKTPDTQDFFQSQSKSRKDAFTQALAERQVKLPKRFLKQLLKLIEEIDLLQRYIQNREVELESYFDKLYQMMHDNLFYFGFTSPYQAPMAGEADMAVLHMFVMNRLNYDVFGLIRTEKLDKDTFNSLIDVLLTTVFNFGIPGVWQVKLETAPELKTNPVVRANNREKDILRIVFRLLTQKNHLKQITDLEVAAPLILALVLQELDNEGGRFFSGLLIQTLITHDLSNQDTYYHFAPNELGPYLKEARAIGSAVHRFLEEVMAAYFDNLHPHHDLARDLIEALHLSVAETDEFLTNTNKTELMGAVMHPADSIITSVVSGTYAQGASVIDYYVRAKQLLDVYPDDPVLTRFVTYFESNATWCPFIVQPETLENFEQAISITSQEAEQTLADWNRLFSQIKAYFTDYKHKEYTLLAEDDRLKDLNAEFQGLTAESAQFQVDYVGNSIRVRLFLENSEAGVVYMIAADVMVFNDELVVVLDMPFDAPKEQFPKIHTLFTSVALAQLKDQADRANRAVQAREERNTPLQTDQEPIRKSRPIPDPPEERPRSKKRKKSKETLESDGAETKGSLLSAKARFLQKNLGIAKVVVAGPSPDDLSASLYQLIGKKKHQQVNHAQAFFAEFNQAGHDQARRLQLDSLKTANAELYRLKVPRLNGRFICAVSNNQLILLAYDERDSVYKPDKIAQYEALAENI